MSETVRLVMEIGREQVKARKMLRHPSCVLPLRDLLAYAWVCGAVDVLVAQSKHDDAQAQCDD